MTYVWPHMPREKERKKDRNPMIWETYVRVYSTMGEQKMKKKKGESCQVEHERVLLKE